MILQSVQRQEKTQRKSLRLKVQVTDQKNKAIEEIYASRGASVDVEPDIYFYIEGVAVEGLFISSNKQAGFPHGFFTNPKVEKEIRSEAIDLIITSMIQFAMFHRMRFLHSGARKGSFADKFISQGFVVEPGEYQSAYLKL